jgi:nitroreductase/FMN reductase [NAD(P)H]
MSDPAAAKAIEDALALRFGESFSVDPVMPNLGEIARMAARGVTRRFLERAVEPELLRLLCACALSAPTKSDLQQADIIIVKDADKRRVIADLIPDQPFIRSAPSFLIFLANGRRLPAISKLRGKPFPNDHLDLFFNASVDAAIALATFVRAADAVGLNTCPISVIRDHAARITSLLELPPRVVPLAGMCVGWPAEKAHVSARLPLACTLHQDRYDEGDLAARIDAYDRRRAAIHPHKPRDPARWGAVDFYGWSEDKARQYGVPQRADFGAYVRKQGFRLD